MKKRKRINRLEGTVSDRSIVAVMAHRAVIIVTLLLFTVVGFVASAASKGVEPGDDAAISFTCRLRSGEVVAAAGMSSSRLKALPKSVVYLSRFENTRITVAVGRPVSEQVKGKERSFEGEVVDRLAIAIVGMEEGKSRKVRLTARELPERTQEEYSIRVSRVRVRPKEMTMTVGDFKHRTGKAPEVGQAIKIYPSVKSKVKTITDKETVIEFSAIPGEVVKTPFGSGKIRETKDAYEIVIDASTGTLVRTGALVGRITKVEDRFITLDYRHPFGGEELMCDVTVETVSKKEAKHNGMGE